MDSEELNKRVVAGERMPAPNLIYGASALEWQAAFNPTVRDFYADRFLLTVEGGLIRIAFGRGGPPTNETGSRGVPTYFAAVSVNAGIALQLATVLAQQSKPLIEAAMAQQQASEQMSNGKDVSGNSHP